MYSLEPPTGGGSEDNPQSLFCAKKYEAYHHLHLKIVIFSVYMSVDVMGKSLAEFRMEFPHMLIENMFFTEFLKANFAIKGFFARMYSKMSG